MKKPKNDSAIMKEKVKKRKPDDVLTTSPESKKMKKRQKTDTGLPSSQNKSQVILKKKKHLVEKKKNISSLKHIQKSKGNKEEASFIFNKTEQAPRVLKMKKKVKIISPQSNVKKLKKQSQQTVSQKESCTGDSHDRASQDSANGLKKQKNKKNPVKRDQNAVKGKGISIGSEERLVMKKKKKSLKEGQSIEKAASVSSAGDSKQAKKKKKKKNQVPLQSSASENFSPTKSLQKQTKNKLHKKKENVVPLSKRPHTGDQIKEVESLSPSKPNAPELSKKRMKFLKFIKLKEEHPKGKLSKPGQIKSLKEEESKAGPYPQLKGKALRKRFSNISETIAKLEKLNHDQAIHLLKATSDGKKKKIKERIQKIKTKISGLETELAFYQPKVKGPTPQVVNNKVVRQLPQDPPPKKKEKPVELKEFLQNQMKASRFRWLNENLYNSSSSEAQGFFKDDPESFRAYHEGYSEQVAKWPVNPLEVIIEELKSLSKESVVADLGCGDAKLAAALPHLRVHSLDFIALKPEVIACDMAHCPLLRSSVDVVVFCLSLMGTNVSDFLLEANRILKTGGTMEIAEVESRFERIDDFIEKVQQYGFQLKKQNLTDMFFFLTFTKKQDTVKTKKLPDFELKPCVYKKR